MKSKFNSAKNFVARHKIAITVASTAVATTGICVYAYREGVEQYDEFLKEHNLYDQFYSFEGI